MSEQTLTSDPSDNISQEVAPSFNAKNLIPAEGIVSPSIPAEGIPSPSLIKIKLFDPKGNKVVIGASDLSEALKTGYQLPGYVPKQEDFAQDGKLKVFDPTGRKVLIDATDYEGALQAGYKLASQGDHPQEQAAKQLLIDRDLKSIQYDDSATLIKNHASDDIKDSSGNYKLISPNGEPVSLPIDQLDKALAKNYKFADPNFQSLVSAHLQNLKNPTNSFSSTANEINKLTGSFQEALPFGSTFNNALINKADIPTQAEAIAQKLNSVGSVASTLGTVGGVAAQVLTPGGIFGEISAATKAGAAVKSAAALADSPIIAGVLSNVVKGMTIAAPQVADALIKQNPKLAAEQLALGGGLGVIFGQASNIANAYKGMRVAGAADKLPGMVDQTLNSIGADEQLLQQSETAKQKLISSLSSAGLKESSNAETTIKVLRSVGAGNFISVLPKLDKISEELVQTGHLSLDLADQVHGIDGLSQPSNKLVSALSEVNGKLDKLFPEGTASLTELQKVASDIVSDLPKGRISDEVSNFKLYAHDAIMKQIYEIGDQAALKADVKTAALWGEQKAISQGATSLQQGFNSAMQTAEQLSNKPITETWLNKLAQSANKRIFTGVFNPVGWADTLSGDALSTKTEKFLNDKANVINNFIENIQSSSAKSWLQKAANENNPNIGSYLAMNAVHDGTKMIGQISEIYQNIGTKLPLAFRSAENPIQGILDEQSNGLSKQQQFTKLSDTVANLAGNPNVMESHLNNIIAPFQQDHPELAAALKDQIKTKIIAANDLIHANASSGPQPFQKTTKYQPNASQIMDMEKGLKLIENPYSLMEGIKNGRVDSKQVSLVEKTHPAILAEIRNELIKEAFNGKTELNYQQKLGVSQVIGQSMDPSLRQIAQLQAQYQTPPAPQTSGKKGGGHSHKLSSANSASSHMTQAQRLSK